MTTQDDYSFDTVWPGFPRRQTTPRITGKRKFREKCEALVKAGIVTWKELTIGVEQYARCDNVQAGYIKLPETWINNYGWEDEYDSIPDEGSDEWQRGRCRDALSGPYALQNFNRHYRNTISKAIRAEYPDLFASGWDQQFNTAGAVAKLRAVE